MISLIFAILFVTLTSSRLCSDQIKLRASNITETSALIKWDPIPEIFSYQIEMKPFQGKFVNQIKNFTGTEFQVKGLEPCGRYLFNGEAHRQHCVGEWDSKFLEVETKCSEPKAVNLMQTTSDSKMLSEINLLEKKEKNMQYQIKNCMT